MFSYYFVIAVFLWNSANCLVQLPTRNNSIEVIDGTLNKLFSSLKLKDISTESRLDGYSTLYKYFNLFTLQISNNRNKIIDTLKINDKNDRDDLVETINAVLDEHDVRNDSKRKDEIDIGLLISVFLNESEYFKEDHDYDDTYVNINTDVLKRLRNLKPMNTNNSILNISTNSDVLMEDNEFWLPSGRRIFKGKRTKIRRFPFMASIHVMESFYCAGSIIKSDLIITACSCLQLAWNNRFFRENPMFLSARVGSSFYEGGGDVISVLEVYFHPGYNPKTLKHNVCVMRLSRHIRFSRKHPNVRKIDFDRSPWPLAVNTQAITIVGWGAKERSGIIGDPFKNIISYDLLDIYPFHECRDIYTKAYVTKNNFCAGFLSRGGGACNRDVGAPGILGGKLLGIVSFGSNVCGTPNAPTVFTKVGFYAEWIEEIMEQDVPLGRKRTTLNDFNKYPIAAPDYISPAKLKIQPVGSPSSTSIIENNHDIGELLRIFDKDLFKEFLETMFDDKDAKNVLKTIDIPEKQQLASGRLQDDKTFEITATPDFSNYKGTHHATQIIPFDNEEEYGGYNNENVEKVSITPLDETRVPFTQAILNEEEISKFLDEVDLEEIIHQEVMKIGKENSSESNMDSQDQFNGETLDLLYLTDAEDDDTKTNYVNNPDDKESDVVVGDKKFVDLTRGREEDQLVPVKEIYKVLAEIIREQTPNKVFKN